MKKTIFLTVFIITGALIFAGGNKEEAVQEVPTLAASDTSDAASGKKQPATIEDVAELLGVDTEDLKKALWEPGSGEPDFAAAAGKLGLSEEKLKEGLELMRFDPAVDPYPLTLNGMTIEVIYETFTWDTLPDDVEYERMDIVSFTNVAGVEHYYETVYVASGNLNWYQAAALADDAGGYLACPATEDENAFVFSLVNDTKFFWKFPEEGGHYGISIGPFLGGYQPEGSPEPDGGWLWLSGDAWEWTHWAQNLDDGVTDKDPRDNTQPNNSGTSQPIMGFGEMNIPVPTWGDYMEAVGTYGVDKGPGFSYGFIIEYEKYPQ